MSESTRLKRPEATGRRARLAVITLALGSAAGLVALVAARNGAPLPTDLAVRELVTAIETHDGVRLAAALTQLGAGPVLYPVLLAVCAWSAVGRRSAREFLPVLALAAGQVLELVLFATLRRPLPLTGDAGLPHTTFSSGHTAAAVLGWGLVVWQLRRALTTSPRTPLVWAIALTTGAVVGGTRVYLRVHWLSDAVAGVIAGAVLLAAVLVGLEYVERRWPARGRTAPAPPAAESGRPPAVWLKTSPWAWTIPAAAAALPVVLLLATPPGERVNALGWGLLTNLQGLTAVAAVFLLPYLTHPPRSARRMLRRDRRAPRGDHVSC